MGRRLLLCSFGMLVIVVVVISCCVPKARQYVNKFFTDDLPMDTVGIPPKNRALLRYAEQNGKKISPTYKLRCAQNI